MRRWLWVLVLTSACAGSPVAPTTPSCTVALSGQSNAEFLAPFLRAATPCTLVGAWESGLNIAFWQPQDRMWRALQPTLHQPLHAFVWWQGESDPRYADTYAAALADLMTRVRQEAGQPDLLVALVRIAPEPEFASIRQIQETWVAGDQHAVLVSSDDMPLRPGEVHLTDAGYRQMAARIARVVQ